MPEEVIEHTAWLSLDEAAKKLSSTNFQYSVKDILRLILEKKLKLHCLIRGAYGYVRIPYCPLVIPHTFQCESAHRLGYCEHPYDFDGQAYQSLSREQQVKVDELAYEMFSESDKILYGSHRIDLNNIYRVDVDSLIEDWFLDYISGVTDSLNEEIPEELILFGDKTEITYRPYDSVWDSEQDDVGFFYGDIYPGFGKDDPSIKEHSEYISFLYSRSPASKLGNFINVSVSELLRLKHSYNDEARRFQPDPPWQSLTELDLFTSPPRTDTDIYDYVREMVRKYIKANSSLPTDNQLWRFISADDRCEPIGKNRLDSPAGQIDRDNFKKNFKNWTKPKKS